VMAEKDLGCAAHATASVPSSATCSRRLPWPAPSPWADGDRP
jgi:hypothetical protein